jgi:gag-polyprotein putative aspartyl protease
MNRFFSFPYKRFFNDYYPIIKIHLKGPNGITELEAYVDSGASTSIFDVSVAHDLRIDYTKGKRRMALVGNGAHMSMYVHKIPIKIGNIWVKTTVGFSSELGSSINLLGQKDIFDSFKITFDTPGKCVIFKPYKF